MLQHYLSQGPSSDLLNQIAHFFNFWVRIWIQEMLKASDNGLSVVMSMFGPLFPLNINFSYFPVLYLLAVVVFASKPTKAAFYPISQFPHFHPPPARPSTHSVPRPAAPQFHSPHCLRLMCPPAGNLQRQGSPELSQSASTFSFIMIIKAATHIIILSTQKSYGIL